MICFQATGSSGYSQRGAAMAEEQRVPELLREAERHSGFVNSEASRSSAASTATAVRGTPLSGHPMSKVRGPEGGKGETHSLMLHVAVVPLPLK